MFRCAQTYSMHQPVSIYPALSREWICRSMGWLCVLSDLSCSASSFVKATAWMSSFNPTVLVDLSPSSQAYPTVIPLHTTYQPPVSHTRAHTHTHTHQTPPNLSSSSTNWGSEGLKKGITEELVFDELHDSWPSTVLPVKMVTNSNIFLKHGMFQLNIYCGVLSVSLLNVTFISIRGLH